MNHFLQSCSDSLSHCKSYGFYSLHVFFFCYHFPWIYVIALLASYNQKEKHYLTHLMLATYYQ